MNRRTFLTTLPALAAARALLAAAGAAKARIGICSFSCHQHWKAVNAKAEGVKFTDALTFYRYARELGAEGVQTGLRSTEAAVARQMRALVEESGGYYEADVRLPKTEADLAAFETEVRLAREAGAGVARAVFMGERRYEVFKSLDDFRRFEAQVEKTLALMEPVARRHGLKVAIENHKDHTADEFAAHLRRLGSEWVGALVDTGNNLALCEDPYEAMATLAPFAMSVHFKDMAVQRSDSGFLLSEVPLGTGALDLPRIIATLVKANPRLVFNLEMATRDPLRVPCLTDGYFVTFPERKARRLDATMQWVQANPPKQAPPSVSGKPTAQILAEEEANNRASLGWMQTNLHA
ncbi:MAG TPA: sugar phosphate isomerase/epimerase family protein [Chthoniobacteraceae bacterium]|jgi:sugar phosphate isomerase/epimerase|nr:sugar phosphate isomerase/epimerase family protein [Chthoniobacteraceae bacterium]